MVGTEGRALLVQPPGGEVPRARGPGLGRSLGRDVGPIGSCESVSSSEGVAVESVVDRDRLSFYLG